jgi:hypothetical protein
LKSILADQIPSSVFTISWDLSIQTLLDRFISPSEVGINSAAGPRFADDADTSVPKPRAAFWGQPAGGKWHLGSYLEDRRAISPCSRFGYHCRQPLAKVDLYFCKKSSGSPLR